MSKTLVIVESPAKSKTIQKYLGKDYIVKASFGHIRDLPEKELGVDVEDNFKPKYITSPTKTKIVKELQEQAQKVDRILLASDPDREGEAISWHLNYVLKRYCKDIHRVEFHEITNKAVNEAISNPHEINLDLVNSQQSRRILDRIVGYKLSPWLSKIMRGRLSAGRVQSVALRIICDREDEINNFKPEEYWKIYANLTPLNEDFPFVAELYMKGKDKVTIPDENTAKQILLDLQNALYKVEQIIKKEKKKNAAPPFTTSTLQQEASRKLNWDSSKTMKIAQELYEGLELEDNSPHGLITYMRTDSTRISEDFQKTTLDYIKSKWGKEYSPTVPNIYKTKDGAQDAHEAIRPTDALREPDKIQKYLNKDQFLLYKLIWERYIASQMEAAIYDTVSVVISANNYLFKATGYSIRFDGFMTLYTEDKDEENTSEDKENDKEKKLPQLKEKETLKLIKLDPKQKFTTPPSRFTEATLIKELEKLGVGRPSTYATIISTIKGRNYVEVKAKKFYSTELGHNVVNMLVQYFPDVMDVKFTAAMEEDLDIVAEGKKYWVNVLKDFYDPFAIALAKAEKEVKPMEQEVVYSDTVCPNCGKPMIEKQGKYGPFLGCSGYPDCKTILPIEKKFNDTGVTCDKCGKPMIVREVKKGRKTEYFLGCIGYPDCKNTIPCDKNGKPMDKPKVEETDKVCPDCGKPMLLREGKNGKFYSCSGYPDCKKTQPYIDPKQDTKECPECGKPMILRNGKTGKFWGCTGYPDCKKTLPHGETKECPECGSLMAKRKGAKGDFWGCTNYPTCKHTENI